MAVTIADVLNTWEAIGVFDLLLPFLLVFAIVFGILTSTNILGSNKGIHTIVAAVIGLLALRFGYFAEFLSELAPRLGIGIAVIISILILVGMFIPDQERRFWYWGLGAIGTIVTIVLISKTFDVLGWTGNLNLGGEFIGYVIGGVALVGLIIAIASSGSSGSSAGSAPKAPTIVSFTPHRT